MKTINTIQNDTWDKISLRVYGSEIFIDKLIEANPSKSKIFIFNSGVTLNVPEIDTDSSLINSGLPPWKQ